MLRLALIVVGVALLGLGLIIPLVSDSPSGVSLLICGGVLVIAALIERWRYRPKGCAKNARWQRTGERFEDVDTGRTVEVLYDPASGERRYVPTQEDHIS